jgi:hypothetical protein
MFYLSTRRGIFIPFFIHQVENEELHEFELLEQFADDNASFLSNISAVNRALTQKREGEKQRSVIIFLYNNGKMLPFWN